MSSAGSHPVFTVRGASLTPARPRSRTASAVG